MNVKQLQSRIKKLGLPWTATPTSMSSLSLKELRNGYLGAQTDPKAAVIREKLFTETQKLSTQRQLMQAKRGGAAPPAAVAPKGTASGLPEEYNCVDNNEVSTPKNQGTCNSCVAFSVCAAVEARMNRLTGQSANLIDLSEGHLFFGGCSKCCKHGWHVSDALNHCILTGLVSQQSFGYDPATQSPPPAGIKPVIKIKRWDDTVPWEQIKYAISTSGPVVAKMDFYEDLKGYGLPANGSDPHIYVPSTSAATNDTHAVAIVGYNDKLKYWLCKNSWGTGWGMHGKSDGTGDRGYFRIAYGACRIGTSHPVFDFDIDIDNLISLQDATNFLNSVRNKALNNGTFKECLRTMIQDDPFGGGCLGNFRWEDLAFFSKDLVEIYPSLKPILVGVIGNW